MTPDPQLLKDFEREVTENRDTPVVLDLSLLDVVSLIPGLQLALRHPSFNGSSAEVARRVIADVLGALEMRGFHGIVRVLRIGNDPANDYELVPAKLPAVN